MTLADGTHTEVLGPGAPERFAVALVGQGPKAEPLLRMLADAENIVVAAVWAPASDAPVARLARELRIPSFDQVDDVFEIPALDLVLDVSKDTSERAQLSAACPDGVEVLAATSIDLVWDLMIAKQRCQEQERLFIELRDAYDQIQGHEQRLEASKDELQAANAELERRLAEIFFTHEFFKALTASTTIQEVCSLIVDGCNGILGAEISCVYLFRREDWTLRLRASQGRPETAFRQSVPVSDTILGQAFREGIVQEVDAECPGQSTAWLSGECTVHSQAAVALKTGDVVIGVIALASADRRELSPTEIERLTVLSNQSSLSLQNALLHAELERLSVTDRLTDLYNHGYFKQRLDEEFKRAARFGHRMSLIMFDLDDFKAFNDTFGHPRGDVLLKAVSGVIKESLRSMDVAARYGGEEFVVVLPETDTDGAMAVGERIRAGVEALRIEGPESAPVVKTISVGVATFPHHAASALRLLEAADNAMYSAKRAGKNRVVSAGS